MTGRGAAGVERVALCVAVLAAGAAFSVLFSASASGPSSGFGFGSLVGLFGGGAFPAFFGAALLAFLVGSAGRFRLVLLPPAILLYTLLAAYGAPPLSLSGLRELAQRVGADLLQASNTMYFEPAPYVVAPGLIVVFVPMVMVICAFATSAALYERAPLISIATLGLTVGVLSTISFEAGIGPFFAVFLLGSLVLALFSGAGGEGRSLRRVGLVGAALVGGVVLLLPSLPFASATLSGGSIDWTEIGTGGPSRLDVQADVGEYLNSGRETELMRVSSTEPLYWRGGTLDSFDGVRWSSTTGDGSYGDYGEEVAEGIPSSPVVQSVEVLDSETDLIFGGYRISGISNDVPDASRNADGSWTAGEPFTEGDYYRILSEVPQPTAAQLRRSGTAYPESVREKYLDLPASTPENVSATAEEIRQNYNTNTPYATARAVERYLTTDGGFTYNLDVDYRRADWAVEEFLGDGREGFCTQFATAMTLILRDMDVPSRVVYGATTGEEVGENVYLVRGENMHTWVEVYFPGVGWYPFDPTPGFAMPETMQSNVPRLDETPSLGDGTPQAESRATEEREQEAPEELEVSPEEDPARTGDAASGAGLPGWLGVALLGGLLVAAVPVTKRLLLSRGRPEDYYRDLAGRLADALPPGSVAADEPPSSLTVEERLSLLSGALGLDGRPFAGFADAYSEHLYAREVADGRAIRRAYRRAVSEYAKLPLWRRALAALNPASLLGRARRRLSGEASRLAGSASVRAAKVRRTLEERLGRRP